MYLSKPIPDSRMRHLKALGLGAAALACLAAPAAAQNTLTFHSGNGVIGGNDSLIQVQGSSTATPFNDNSGQALEQAILVAPDPLWQPAIAGSTWISSSGNRYAHTGSYEYFLNFTLPADTTSASITVQWAADDAGFLLINNQFVTGATSPGYYVITTSTADISSLVQGGVNRLSFGVDNGAPTLPNPNPTGLDFTATIIASAPEPSGYAALGMGALGVGGLLLRTRRRRRQTV
jgi:hypothetical protein